MAASSEKPEPPRIARLVRIEASVTTLLGGVAAWLAWNVLIAPYAVGVGPVNFWAVLGAALIVSWSAQIWGYGTGEGVVRRQIAAHEQYAESAAAYLTKVAREVEDDEPVVRGGQG